LDRSATFALHLQYEHHARVAITTQAWEIMLILFELVAIEATTPITSLHWTNPSRIEKLNQGFFETIPPSPVATPPFGVQTTVGVGHKIHNVANFVNN